MRHDSFLVIGVTNVVRHHVAGLEMIVNIDQANYVKDAGETAGIRLVVHTGDRMPFPEDEGITVSPGHSSSIGLQKVSNSSLIGRQKSQSNNARRERRLPSFVCFSFFFLYFFWLR